MSLNSWFVKPNDCMDHLCEITIH